MSEDIGCSADRTGQSELPVLSWLREDRCLETMLLFTEYFGENNAKVRSGVENLIAAHEQAHPGLCFSNVIVAADDCREPAQREFYWLILEAFMATRITALGWRVTVEEQRDGVSLRLALSSVPEGADPIPFTAIEKFIPSDCRSQISMRFYVSSEELYKNPGALIQHLDKMATREIKAFEKEGGLRHWRRITTEEKQTLIIGWQGKTSEWARGLSLSGRYGNLIQARSRRAEYVEKYEGYDRHGSVDAGTVALILMDMALRYDERSWFAGYLDWTLSRRWIDAGRKADRTPLSQAQSIDYGDREASADHFGFRTERNLLAELSGAPDPEDQMIEQIDRRQIMTRLQARLTPPEQEILGLKLQDLTDQAIARRIGRSRVTVNTRWQAIKRRAASMKG